MFYNVFVTNHQRLQNLSFLLEELNLSYLNPEERVSTASLESILKYFTNLKKLMIYGRFEESNNINPQLPRTKLENYFYIYFEYHKKVLKE